MRGDSVFLFLFIFYIKELFLNYNTILRKSFEIKFGIL